jgi:hypothetical protein
MTRKIINVGSGILTGDGEPLRDALIKINDNFEEIYNQIPTDISQLTDNQGLQTFFTGDIKGSVFGDDSTLLVDGVNSIIPGYVSLETLKEVVANSTNFEDFQSRIASL